MFDAERVGGTKKTPLIQSDLSGTCFKVLESTLYSQIDMLCLKTCFQWQSMSLTMELLVCVLMQLCETVGITC